MAICESDLGHEGGEGVRKAKWIKPKQSKYVLEILTMSKISDRASAGAIQKRMINKQNICALAQMWKSVEP